MKGLEPASMIPWYKGFQGTIELNSSGKGCDITGNYKVLADDELEITELPIGKWTGDYKKMLEEMA